MTNIEYLMESARALYLHMSCGVSKTEQVSVVNE